MATNAASNGDAAPGKFPTALPIEVPYRSRLSWELGTRVVGDAEAQSLCRWRAESGWALAVFGVTSRTLVARFRTPVGRELFYGLERASRSTVRARLESAPDWQRIE
jgi:hypothetical protein